MHGNVSELVQDCWNDSYRGAPTDGSAWTGDCDHRRSRVVRGTSWYSSDYPYAWRFYEQAGTGSDRMGFRVARKLDAPVAAPKADAAATAKPAPQGKSEHERLFDKFLEWSDKQRKR
jgi:hypothetical protein